MSEQPDLILKDFLDLLSKAEDLAKTKPYKHGPYKEWTDLPIIKFKRSKSKQAKTGISGPHLEMDGPVEESDVDKVKDVAFGKAISTYPNGMGVPICDYYSVRLYEKRSLICLADGCGWGRKSREAAAKATRGYMKYLEDRQSDILDLRDVGRLILRSFQQAHKLIVEGHDDLMDAGTTALCGGIILQLDESKENLERLKKTTLQLSQLNKFDFSTLKTKMPQTKVIKRLGTGPKSNKKRSKGKGKEHVDNDTDTDEDFGDGDVEDLEQKLPLPTHLFVCASVGDCKAFHYSTHTKQFTDITAGNRTNLTDAKDPGGFLGPSCEKGSPDLRNLALYMVPCLEGDLILCVSDGVHDNLDPQHLGLPPLDIGVAGFTDWKVAEKDAPDQTDSLKNDFRLRLMKKIVSEVQDLNTGDPDPEKLTDILLEHAFQLTFTSRNFIESNPKGGRVPDDYTKFPGKMDHTSCAVCVVGGKAH